MLHRMTPEVARLRNFSHLPKSVWSLGHCRLAFLTLNSSHFDPFVWSGRASQEVSSIWRLCGLASMYPASDWSVLCPGPS